MGIVLFLVNSQLVSNYYFQSFPQLAYCSLSIVLSLFDNPLLTEQQTGSLQEKESSSLRAERWGWKEKGA